MAWENLTRNRASVDPSQRPLDFHRCNLVFAICALVAFNITWAAVMITLEDCIGMCDLSEAEILAIGEHEHIPEIVAAAMGDYLIHQEHGAEKIRDMIKDDIRASLNRHDNAHANVLLATLQHFLTTHPEAA